MQKGGTSSLPPFSLRFHGSEKTGRNRENTRPPKLFFQSEVININARTMSLVYVFVLALAVEVTRLYFYLPKRR
jgi:hypothetical protein